MVEESGSELAEEEPPVESVVVSEIREKEESAKNEFNWLSIEEKLQLIEKPELQVIIEQ